MHEQESMIRPFFSSFSSGYLVIKRKHFPSPISHMYIHEKSRTSSGKFKHFSYPNNEAFPKVMMVHLKKEHTSSFPFYYSCSGFFPLLIIWSVSSSVDCEEEGRRGKSNRQRPAPSQKRKNKKSVLCSRMNSKHEFILWRFLLFSIQARILFARPPLSPRF